MPGRYELIDIVWRELESKNVSAIVCLVENEEIRLKSTEYAQALETGAIPCPVLRFEVPDRSAPANRDDFWLLAREIAARLSAGQSVLVHCAGGVGRTAMFAACVLVALGESESAARGVISRAGSTVETTSQREVVAWCAGQRRTLRGEG